jgi:hypothetical protein
MVDVVEGRPLAHVGVAGVLLPRLGRRDVDVVRRVEVLGLRAGIDLEVIQRELAPEPEPGVVDQERDYPVIAMGVDGPVREDDVRLLLREDLAELVVAGGADLRRAVDLAREERARLQDRAGLLDLGRADRRGLLVRLALDAASPRVR